MPVSPPVMDHLIDQLTRELGDRETAEFIASVVADTALTWTAPSIAEAEIDTIAGFAFGNRPNAQSGDTPMAGNQAALADPGPINALLADAVATLAAARPSAKIYAQWEIARFLTADHGLTEVVSIEPVIAADGTVTYLSTDGVAEAIIVHAGSAEALGKVAVIGHRDHARRCVLTAQARGMDAYLPAGIDLPVDYDAQSGQVWTRSRKAYLVTDIFARLNATRLNLMG